MAYSHTNKIIYNYTAGGSTTQSSISKTETWGAEMNVSHPCITHSVTETTDIDIDYFDFPTAAQARSVYLRMDGYNCALYGGDGTAKMVDLDDGEPYVWSYNGTVDFPAGNANPMENATVLLRVTPDAGAGTSTSGNLTVRVLYDPT
jgi:hypothetical protein